MANAPFIKSWTLEGGFLDGVEMSADAKFLSAEGTKDKITVYFLLQYQALANICHRSYHQTRNFRWFGTGVPLPLWIKECRHLHTWQGNHLFELPDWAVSPADYEDFVLSDLDLGPDDEDAAASPN